ncbi:MAG TPA: hypothetical protein VMF91_02405, partial [Bryobacteraceae bacterium]|nr:hypothetical protein [Bryobacteraceae bacterium]
METQRFQTVIARARAHRVAILVDINDPYWELSCVGVIQFLTKLWGGALAVIIPTDGKTISEEFWAILSAHDPDKILCYKATGDDLKRADPAKFNSYVDQWVQGNLPSSGMEEPVLRAQMEEQLLHTNLDGFAISEELSQELVMRICPLHYEPEITESRARQLDLTYIARGNSPSYPLTSVLEVIPFAKSAEVVSDVVIDNAADAPPALWLAAAMGSNDQAQIAALKEINVESRTFHTSQLSPFQLVSLGTTPGETLKTRLPWALPMTALAYYRSAKAMRYQLPTVVMVGDSISDFCMFYGLRCLKGRASWLPKWFFKDTGSYSSRLATAVRGAAELGRGEHSEQLALASFSLSSQDLNDAKTTIDAALFSRGSSKIEPNKMELLKSQLRNPFRSCTDGTIGDISTRMFVGGELPGSFDTPRPLKIDPLNPQQHRWMVDVIFDKYMLPRHPAIAAHVIGNSNLVGARTGNEAVSYGCPGMFVMGTDMDTNLIRPQIRIPSCEKVFEVALRDCKYESRISDKGSYAAQTSDKFGGLEQIGWSLRTNEGTLLRKFLDTTDPPKGSHEDGTYLNDKRRYLNFQAITKVLGRDEDAIRVIDSYVSKGIFYRGFIFKCARCSDVAWFSISDISETFKCRRCRTIQPYTKESWRHPNEPAWFYQLDEIVYQTLLNNGDIPMLALDFMRRRSSESFLHCPELRIRPEGSKKDFIEIDVCCISDGRMCIGEAKSNDSIATNQFSANQTAERYRDLALKMGASIVVFATSRTVWCDSTFDAIKDAFETYPYIEVLTLGSGGFPLHIVHLVTAQALNDLRRARADGLPVTAETCPHYLYFADEEIADGSTIHKCAPPIRSAENRELLWEALRRGEIDLIATDHSPCPPEWKVRGGGSFAEAWGGIASVSVALPAVWTGMRRRGFSLSDLVRLMAEKPAHLAGLRG